MRILRPLARSSNVSAVGETSSFIILLIVDLDSPVILAT